MIICKGVKSMHWYASCDPVCPNILWQLAVQQAIAWCNTGKGGLMTTTANHCSPTAASIKLLMSCPFVAVSGGVTLL